MLQPLLVLFLGVLAFIEFPGGIGTDDADFVEGLDTDFSFGVLESSPCTSLSPDNKTCILSGYLRYEGDFVLNWNNGDVVIEEQAKLVGKNNIIVYTTGWLNISRNASIISNGVTLSGKSVLLNQGVTINIPMGGVSISCVGLGGAITIEDKVRVDAETIVFVCEDGQITMTAPGSCVGDGCINSEDDVAEVLSAREQEHLWDFVEKEADSRLVATRRLPWWNPTTTTSTPKSRTTVTTTTTRPLGRTQINIETKYFTIGSRETSGSGDVVRNVELSADRVQINLTGPSSIANIFTTRPTGAVKDASCAFHKGCRSLIGLCCPNEKGIRLACCNSDPDPSYQTFAVSIHIDSTDTVTLGASGLSWSIDSFQAFAKRLVIADGHKIQSLQRTSCGNNAVVRDQCAFALEHARSRAPFTLDLNFDLVLASIYSVKAGKSASLRASTTLICSNSHIDLSSQVTIDADGRGCRAETGHNGTEGHTLSQWFKFCGASGGSSLGSGGAGLRKADMVADMLECTKPGAVTTEYSVDEQVHWKLPTQGAGGGGCGVPPQGSGELAKECVKLRSDYKRAAGGGLVWMSAPEINFEIGVSVSVDGTPGDIVQMDDGRGDLIYLVAGGGAGGQIIINTTAMNINSPGVKLSARGGDGKCEKDHSSVGGGGGGGFIGLAFMGDAMGRRTARVYDGVTVNVAGGNLSADCASLDIGAKAQETAQGKIGLAQSIGPCPPGFEGMFCTPCPVGTWTDGNGYCGECHNKPKENAEYFETAWNNETCPWRCVASVPEIEVNPQCFNTQEYMIWCIGGYKTIVYVCVAVVVTFFVLIFCRQRKRLAQARAKRIRIGSGIDGEDLVNGVFSRDQLPYHCGRVFATGQNRHGMPWALSAGTVDHASRFVIKTRWVALTHDFGKRAAVPKWEVVVERMLSKICPPLASVFALRRRQVRAKRIKKWITRLTQEPIWESKASVSGDGSWRPLMCFSSDDGATLGYLDFFDLSIPLVDWVPVCVGDQARLLVAAGLGQQEDPYAIDMSDPLVHQLCETSMGASAVYGVISAFNQVARRMSAAELQQGGRGERSTLKLVISAVESIAIECGLKETVRVLILQSTGKTSWTRGQEMQPASPNDVEPAGGGVAGMSFTDLVTRWRTTDAPRPRGSFSHNPAQTQKPMDVDYKLCLVFREIQSVSSIMPEVHSGSYSVEPGPLELLHLTSPLPIATVLQAEIQNDPVSFLHNAMTFRGSEDDVTAWNADVRRRRIRFVTWLSWSWNTLLRGRFGLQHHPGSLTSPMFTMVVFVLGLFNEVLFCFIVSLRFFISASVSAIFLWLLLPPLMPLLSSTAGMMFILVDSPRIGMLCARSTLWSIANTTIVVAYLLIIWRDDPMISAMELRWGWLAFFWVGGSKVCFYLCTVARVEYAEVAEDYSLSAVDTGLTSMAWPFRSLTDGRSSGQFAASMLAASRGNRKGSRPFDVELAKPPMHEDSFGPSSPRGRRPPTGSDDTCHASSGKMQWGGTAASPF